MSSEIWYAHATYNGAKILENKEMMKMNGKQIDCKAARDRLDPQFRDVQRFRGRTSYFCRIQKEEVHRRIAQDSVWQGQPGQRAQCLWLDQLW